MINDDSHFLLQPLEFRRLLSSDFTLINISDTQNPVEAYPDVFIAQTRWIANHAADPDYHIAFLSHQGDLLRRGYSTRQADNAAKAMNILNGKVPYTICIGNHDFDNQFDDLDHHISSAMFMSRFGDKRYRSLSNSGFGASSLDQRNRYHLFNAAGRTFMLLSIEWEATDASIAWAQSVIDSHRHIPVILATHEYLNALGRTTAPLDSLGNSGEAIFQKLVKPNSQIFLVLSGHTGAIREQTSANDSANPDWTQVIETVGDFEGRSATGDGFFQLFHFFPKQKVLIVRSYSPVLNRFDPNAQFVHTIDFAKRFSFSRSAVPVANDDDFTALPGDILTGNVITNDFDYNRDALRATLESPPETGQLSLQPDGSFTFTPADGFHGDVSFTYAISDGAHASNTAVAHLHFNTKPSASADSISSPEAAQVTINPFANDADPDGDALVPLLSHLPAHGAIIVNADGTFTYTPDPKFVGIDTVAYRASDGKALSKIAQVEFTITARPPVYDYPISGKTVLGTKSGKLTAVQSDDGVEESIREGPASFAGSLDQRWKFKVTGGDEVTLIVKARRSKGVDEYHLQYSIDRGKTWLELPQYVPASSRAVTRIFHDADQPWQMWPLPASTKGIVFVRATDTNPLDPTPDTLFVDEMVIRSTRVDH